ncbi:transposase [uncultured Thermosynechococcus sp.]|uniref:transposase n=1 Tax=uncultured Thermosynechococcus sp. TaxID=436945 RepID=UPI00344E618F
MKNLKSVSVRKMRQEFAEQLCPYCWKPYFWNRAYGLITTGGRASIETLLKYIQNQDEPRKLRPPLTSESGFPSIRRVHGGVARVGLPQRGG